MMMRTLICLALTIGAVCAPVMLGAQDHPFPQATAPGRGGQLVRTPIEIVELRRIGELDYFVRVDVDSSSKDLQTLIFVQDLKSNRFGLAFDRTAKSEPPGFPFVIGPRPGGLIWASEFSSMWKHSSIRVFAVVAEISENARWDRTKEFESLRYLPFGYETKIEGVLQVLSTFRWRPRGFTSLDAPD
jgi:hypothetical protein